MSPGKSNRYLRTTDSAHSVIDCTTFPKPSRQLFGDVGFKLAPQFHMRGNVPGRDGVSGNCLDLRRFRGIKGCKGV